MWQDVRIALRSFVRKPGFFTVAVATLALGIGATTAIFSVVSAVLLSPLPYAAPERLFHVRGSYPDLRDLRGAPGVAGLAISASNLYDFRVDGAEAYFRGDIVSYDFFSVLGVKPALGRTFTEGEDLAALRLAVISDGLWRRHFGADPRVVGRTFTLNGEPHTVVGVMPPHIGVPSEETQLWVNLRAAERAGTPQGQNRAFRIFRGWGRLADGASLDDVRAASAVVAANLARDYPDTNADFKFDLGALRERLVGDARPALLVLLGMVSFVLLIACANVAHLLLARTLSRGRELAVRMALGAGRGRIVRQILIESLLLALAGGALGVLLALWGVDVLRALGNHAIPRLDEVRVDGGVLLFAASVTIATGVLSGLLPALARTRKFPGPALMMRDGAGDPRRGSTLRRALVVGEVALAVVLVAGAALLGKSFLRLTHVDPGMDPRNLLALHLTLPPGVNPEAPAARVERSARFEQIAARVRAVPGVTAAGVGIALPPTVLQRGTGYLRSGQSEPGEAGWVPVTEGYFAAAGARVLAGRAIDRSDVADGEKVILVSASLARRLFGSPEAAVGQTLRMVNQAERTGESDAARRIAGVIGDVRYQGLDAEGMDMIYTPLAQTPFAWSYLLVRTAGDPAAMIGAVKAAIADAAPEQPASNPRTVASMVAESVAQPRFHTLMLGIFAFVALALAGIGVYGLVAYGVAQRTRDIGIRIALGAGRGQVMRWVLSQGLVLALAGVAAGLAAALGLSRLIAGLLYGTSPTDPAVYAAVAAVLVLIAALASWLPARRAARVDPMVAMRASE